MPPERVFAFLIPHSATEREECCRTQIAARLLARAVRSARLRPVYDLTALKAAYAEFAEEDIALAESGSREQADLLAEEDTVDAPV